MRPTGVTETTAATIPAMRPRLPTAERLLPYLRRIDLSRTYTNWGPLERELASRLCEHFQLGPGAVVTASSGTSALIGAILASAGQATTERPVAIVPALTFTATALAAEQCGYRVHIADVDPDTWQLDPQHLRHRCDLRRVGVVVPVAPFGRPVPQAPWLAFREREGRPVVIDAAASFELVSAMPSSLLGDIPVAISFHATKSFSTGEGGCAASSDSALIEQIGRVLNFGFADTRETTITGTNGKLSEYHAAIGLASLDGWADMQRSVKLVIEAYREQLGVHGLATRLCTMPEIGSNYALFRCASDAEATRVQDGLRNQKIGYRCWYGSGLHRQAYFQGRSRDRSLAVSESLARRLIGLPMAPDLSTTAIKSVVAALTAAVSPDHDR
jgi:dTDP-4-amino-4,6-dideoxygalactose transaminase